jgi:hypothetical protein
MIAENRFVLVVLPIITAMMMTIMVGIAAIPTTKALAPYYTQGFNGSSGVIMGEGCCVTMNVSLAFYRGFYEGEYSKTGIPEGNYGDCVGVRISGLWCDHYYTAFFMGYEHKMHPEEGVNTTKAKIVTNMTNFVKSSVPGFIPHIRNNP